MTVASGSVTEARRGVVILLTLALALGASSSSDAQRRHKRGRGPHWSKVKGISGKLAKEALEKMEAGQTQTTEDVEGMDGGPLMTVGPRTHAQLQADRARLQAELKRDPGNDDLLRELAGVNLRLGDHDAALPAFLQVVKDITQIIYQIAVGAAVVINANY